MYWILISELFADCVLGLAAWRPQHGALRRTYGTQQAARCITVTEWSFMPTLAHLSRF